MYQSEVLLGGVPIRGSPITFNVLAGFPDTKMSRCILPDPAPYPALIAGNIYDLTLVTVDRFGNKWYATDHATDFLPIHYPQARAPRSDDRSPRPTLLAWPHRSTKGGVLVRGKLQGPNMPSGQDPDVQVVDKRDGTYVFKVCLKVSSCCPYGTKHAWHVFAPPPDGAFDLELAHHIIPLVAPGVGGHQALHHTL